MNLQTCQPIVRVSKAGELDGLEGRVRCQLNGLIRELRLLCHEGGVILKGCARSYYAKQIAQHAVMNATSMPILANEIEVT